MFNKNTNKKIFKIKIFEDNHNNNDDDYNYNNNNTNNNNNILKHE